MTVSHRYRNFGNAKKNGKDDDDTGLIAIEDQKLQAFEAGYQAGWDDAIKAKQDEKNQLGADFSQNLKEMSITYQEAMSKLVISMQPVVEGMVSKLLPEIAKNGLGLRICEQINEMITSQVKQPIEIVVSAENVEAIKELAGSNLSEPFTVIAESSLGSGQAFVRVGDSERQVDFDGLVQGVAEAMNGFFHEAQKGLEK